MMNKKGYFSFLLVIMLVAIILIILQANLESRKYTQTEALQLKRMQSISTNAKEVIHELARQGANGGFRDYMAEYAASIAAGHPKKFDVNELKSRMKNEIHNKLSLLDGYRFSDDFDVYIWCGFTFDLAQKINMDNITSGIKKRNDVTYFESDENIYSISNPECLKSIKDQGSPQGTEIPASPTDLGAFNLGSGSGVSYESVIGISIYSQKFNMSGIYFFPTQMNILE